MFTCIAHDLVRNGGAGRRLALAAGVGIACAAALTGGVQAQYLQAGPFVNPTNGNSYYRLHGSIDWFRFQAFARSIGGDLVTIDDAAEQAWVHATLGDGYAYIGINDAVNEGTYRWSSGAPVGFTNWDEAAFGDPENNDFGFMGLIPKLGGTWLLGRNGQWSQAIAELPASQVCLSATELTIDGASVVDTTARAVVNEGERGLCGYAGSPFDGGVLWYRFSGNGGTVRVTTCGPETATDTLLFVFDGDCLWLNCFGFSDDDPCDPSNPLTSAVEFATQCGVEYYVAVKTYQNDEPGVDAGPFAIRVETPEIEGWMVTAPFGVSSAGGSFVVTVPMTPPAAKVYAESLGGQLATITSPAMNIDLAAAVAEKIGPQSVLLGMSSCGGGAYEWYTGEPVTYTNWAPGEPEQAANEPFVRMDEDGTWSGAASPFVCAALIEFRNDECEHAVPLFSQVPALAFNGYGTQQPYEIPCGDVVGGGTWYRFTAAGSNVTVTVAPGVAGAGLDATIRVFEGSCGNLTCLTGAADNPGDGAATELVFYGESEREYFMLVTGVCTMGMFTVTIDEEESVFPAILAEGGIDPDVCGRYALIDNTDWSRCEDVASWRGMHLVTVSGAAGNEAVREFAAANIPAKGSQRVWIGLTDRDGEGEFAWIDGSPVKFTNWAEGQPDDGFGVQDYAMMSLGDGTWTDEHRNSGAYGVAVMPLTTTVGGVIRGGLDLTQSFNGIVLTSSQVVWGGGDATVECWVRTEASGVILSQYAEVGYVPVLYVGLDGYIRGGLWTGSMATSVVTGPYVADGQWRHVALTQDGSELRLMVDGEVVDVEDGVVGASYGNDYTYVIGDGQWTGWPGASGDWGEFNGEIDEFRAWGAGRSVQEIRATMNSRYFNPEVYPNALYCSFTFDEGGGRRALDGVSGSMFMIIDTAAWTYEDRDEDGRTDLCHPLCESDIDANGVVNSTDVSEFINLWFADQAQEMLNADFNRDGVSNSTDVSDYINLWFEESGVGCG